MVTKTMILACTDDHGIGRDTSLDSLVAVHAREKPKGIFIPGHSNGGEADYIARVRRLMPHPIIAVTIAEQDAYTERHLPSFTDMARLGFIYLGGGLPLATRAMLARTGIDHYVNAAYRSGVIIRADSASAMALSERMFTKNRANGPFENEQGLGLITGLHVQPHYEFPGTEELLVAKSRNYLYPIFALERNAAVIVTDNDKQRTITYHCTPGMGNIHIFVRGIKYSLYQTRGSENRGDDSDFSRMLLVINTFMAAPRIPGNAHYIKAS